MDPPSLSNLSLQHRKSVKEIEEATDTIVNKEIEEAETDHERRVRRASVSFFLNTVRTRVPDDADVPSNTQALLALQQRMYLERSEILREDIETSEALQQQVRSVKSMFKTLLRKKNSEIEVIREKSAAKIRELEEDRDLHVDMKRVHKVLAECQNNDNRQELERIIREYETYRTLASAAARKLREFTVTVRATRSRQPSDPPGLLSVS